MYIPAQVICQTERWRRKRWWRRRMRPEDLAADHPYDRRQEVITTMSSEASISALDIWPSGSNMTNLNEKKNKTKKQHKHSQNLNT
jgi:hypothetical protein